MEKRIIGLGGSATAGKDTFANILIPKLEAKGYTVKRIALAAALKGDCDNFCKERFGFSAFTQNIEEKTLIRPMLVWYGDAQRKRTNGRYWINIANKIIQETDYDYYVVTDVRYSHYEKDEVQWIQDELKGTLCHISKWTVAIGNIKMFTLPANDHEAINDPKVKTAADWMVSWPDVGRLPMEELLEHTTLQSYVDPFIDFLESRQKVLQ